MMRFMRTVAPSRAWRLALCAVLCLPMLSCGGDGSGGGSTGLSSGSGGSGSPGTPAPTGPNVASVVVNGGPTSSSPDVNTLFTTVTVCVPGTTNCQTIDNIQVDTGSYGLRILAPVLTISLPVQTASDGSSLVECTAFADGYSWGPVALADVQVSGESASSVPVQVIGSANFTNVPANCSSVGPAEDTVAAFGANGIIGIGVFAQDCGAGCATVVDNQVYYSCPSGSVQCQPTTVALTSQVPNPITSFPTDNNGAIVRLPSVAADGAATVSGYMIFGVDTQTNNSSGSQTLLTLDSTTGDFTTFFNGHSLTTSFLDTGSNGLFFDTSIDTSITPCPANGGFADFYCPTSTLDRSAMLQGQNGTLVSETFSVGDAQTLSGNVTAAPTLAGIFKGADAATTFDWGLPFYFGRSVYTVIEGKTTKAGTGPYVAF